MIKVFYVLISWSYAPGELCVMSSTDKSTYQVEEQWKQGVKGEDWRVMAERNPSYHQRF